MGGIYGTWCAVHCMILDVRGAVSGFFGACWALLRRNDVLVYSPGAGLRLLYEEPGEAIGILYFRLGIGCSLLYS